MVSFMLRPLYPPAYCYFMSTTATVRSLQGIPDGGISVGVFLKNARTNTMDFVY